MILRLPHYIPCESRREWLGALAFWLWIVFALLAMLPATQGTFLMDDFINLNGLQTISAHPDLQHVVAYLAGGHSGPTGRPVSLLTFALQALAGQADTAHLKYVNMLIHLLNGCLLLLLWLRLLRESGFDRQRQEGIAVTVFALWLIHPLQITTVAYIVQRMTTLSATFTLLALLGFMKGRRFALDGQLYKGGAISALSLGLFGILSILAKETGVLTLVYALVIELTLCDARLSSTRFWRWWRRLFLYAPLVLFILLVAFRFNSLVLHGYAGRTFDLWQRLLTEPRVVWDYLGNIIAPSPSTLGIYHDDFRVSTSLLQPWTTLPALLGISGLCLVAIKTRRSAPILAFGIAWYLGGQLLESTIFPLELYFEHRNYLPLAGILTIAVYYVPSLVHRVKLPAVRLALGFSAFVLMIEIVSTSFVAYGYWGEPLVQARIWANGHPDSVRAQVRLAREQFLLGDPENGGMTLRDLTTRKSKSIAGALALMGFSCVKHDLDTDWALSALARAPYSDFNFISLNVLTSIIAAKEQHACKTVPDRSIEKVLTGFLANPAFNTQKKRVLELRARLRFTEGHTGPALDDFNSAYTLTSDPIYLLSAAKRLLAAGQRQDAIAYFDRARAVLARHPVQQAALTPAIRSLHDMLYPTDDAQDSN